MITASADPDRTSAVPAGAHGGNSKVVIKPGYHPRLTNEDLAPLKEQTWTRYNIFAFWMSDVHSVGGYITAGSLFALGLSSWQVLVALLIGIVIVQFFCNLVAKPSQVTGTPYPVMCRASFGVLGANIPAIIRGLDRGRLVRHSDLSGVGGVHDPGAAFLPGTGRRMRMWRSTASSDCRHSAGSPSCSCGCCRRSCSGTAWKPSSTSSTGPARACTW